ncbi:hypothetical protein JCM8547_006855 [Rhodosporidiobolus lusitaniae]
MRQKRVKGYRKVMHLYQQSFGFREPYQLLADAAFVQACVQQKLDIMARLQDVLQGTVKPMITQCCMQVLYDLGPEGQAAVDAAKDFERRKCNHFKARPEDECMLSMAGKDNRNRYVFATQSLDLRIELRKVPSSPIIYIARSVMLLESPSDHTIRQKARMEASKLHVSPEELALITGQPLPSTSASADFSPSDAEDATAVDAPSETLKKKQKQRGPKGPNPLSVKKKKKDQPAQTGRPSKRQREENGGAGEGRESKDEREAKRKREEEAKVVSLAARGSNGAGEGERKKRKRRRKGGATGAGGGGGEGEGGGEDRGEGGGDAGGDE